MNKQSKDFGPSQKGGNLWHSQDNQGMVKYLRHGPGQLQFVRVMKRWDVRQLEAGVFRQDTRFKCTNIVQDQTDNFPDVEQDVYDTTQWF